MGIGNMSPEEAAKMEAEGAAQVARQQAEAAAAGGTPSEGNPQNPADVDDAELARQGFALATSMTSPGGPWHGLPDGAQNDPNHPDWAENQRWACVEGSFWACTFDGTTNLGDHAENVRGYGIPTDEGYAYMRNTNPSQAKKVEMGNQMAYQSINQHLVTRP